MSAHVLRFPISNVTGHEEVDKAAARVVAAWTGWSLRQATAHVDAHGTCVLDSLPQTQGQRVRRFSGTYEVTV